MQSSANPRTLALLLASLVACLAPAAAAAQQQQPRPEEPDDVLRVTTELVQTDVTVIDRDGNFVDGLKSDQFELKVDGKPRSVLFFERVAAGSRNESAQLAAARGARAAGGASAAGAIPLDRGRVILVFVDDIHLSPTNLLQTRTMLTRFVESELRQNDQMLVSTATGQLGFLQQLTDERVVLRAAVARLMPRQQAARDYESPRMTVVQALAIDANDRQLLETFVDLTLRENPLFSGPSARQQAERAVQARASSLAAQANNASSRTLQSLLGLVRTSAQFPGRKVLYFVSDGFAIDEARGNGLDLLRRVADASLRAGVVIYTLDARGLAAHIPDSMTAAERGTFNPSGRLASSTYSEVSATQAPLRVLAGETGGRALLNTNTLGAAIGRTLKETSVYYLLAWRPEAEDTRGERFRRVEVAVKDRPDLSVLAQRGFYSTPPDARPAAAADNKKRDGQAAVNAERQGERELLAAFRAPLPRAGVPVSLTLNYAKAPDERVVLNASVQVEFAATPPAPAATAPTTDRAEVLVAFYDTEGRAVETFRREVTFTPRPGADAGAAATTHSVVVNLQTYVKPGLYQVRAASRDPKNGRTGSDLQWIEIPNLARGNFALSSIFLGDRPPTTANAAPGEGPQVLLTADRRFRRDGRLRFMVQIYNALTSGAGQPDAAIQLQVFRDDQPVVTTPLKKIETDGMTDFSRLAYAAEVSLANLPTGRYTLQLTTIDRLAKASATQRVKFTIE